MRRKASNFVRSLSAVFVVVFAAIPGATSTDSAPALVPNPVETAAKAGIAPTLLSTVNLSMVMRDGLLGIKQPDYPEEQFEKLRSQAVAYIEFRKKNRRHRRWKPSETHGELFSQCLESFDQNPYCYYMTQKWLDLATIPRLRHLFERVQANKVAHVNTRKIASEIRSVKVAELLTYRRFQIQRTLKRFRDWDKIKPLAEATMLLPSTPEEACKAAPLWTALALKAEEFFPDEQYKAIALGLYEKATQCPLMSLRDPGSTDKLSDDEPSALARYRKAMIQIWSQKCSEADKDLESLSEQENGQFVTRGLFWRAWCAKSQGNKNLVQLYKNKLLRVNPMGYHTLLVHNNKGKAMPNNEWAYSREPEIVFSSKTKPYIDLFVRSAEMLHLLDQDALAVEILDHIDEQLDQTEPGYRLYVAALAQRLNAKFLQFRILARLFPDEPTMISTEALKMFYPLEQLDILKLYEKSVDPYLAAALIRQESGFNTNARSRAGALGLMQLMPATARRMSHGISRSQLLRPTINIKLGTRYFNNLVRRFKGDVELALAAYNAGPQNVDQWIERYPTDNRLLFLDLIPFSETRNYVVLIRRNQFWYLNLYSPESLATFNEQYREIASQFE